MNIIHLDIINLLILSLIYGSVLSENSYTLKSVNVFFRHGDRTPLSGNSNSHEYYPNDPYRNKTYDPHGFGALTEEGKLREFALGESLRKLYGYFLGEIYKPTDVIARSTDTPRTKMSTQLVLAGLYPPTNEQTWKQGLKWQPIPILSAPKALDPFLKWTACPLFKKELARVKNTSEYRREASKFDELIVELTDITGKNFKSTRDIFELYHLLSAQKSAKLNLPSWTKRFFPDGPLYDAAQFEYKTQSYNKLLRKFSGGLPISKVLKNMQQVMQKKEGDEPKIFLYGVHENNIAGLLISLNLWKPHVPLYSSAFVFELHQKDTDYFIRMLYYKGIPAEYETMIIPNCTEYCPFEKFIKLNEAILSKSAFETCNGPPHNTELIPQNEDLRTWMYEKFEQWFDL